MARAHYVKKARKTHRGTGVKKGDSYWWWKFRFSGIHRQKTRPKRSQLTQSGFLSTLYDLEDDTDFDRSDLDASRNALIESIEGLRDECQDSLDNMPEHLQESSSSGETLQERIDGLDEWISELESVDCDVDDDLDEDETEDRIDEIVEELSCGSNL